MLTNLALSLVCLATQSGSASLALDPLADFTGAFEAHLSEPLDSGVSEVRFALSFQGEALIGGLRAGEDTALLDGRVSQAGVAELTVTFEGGSGPLWLESRDGHWSGEFAGAPLELRKVADEVPVELRLEVDFDVPRPRTVSRAGLPEFLLESLTPRIDRFLEEGRIVGLSVAVVLDHELVDVRSFGWEDFARRIPASGTTLYRWASISKPVTAVAALQLFDAGKLDLDRDIRTYLPEFPAKRWPVTARDLLRHQAGLVHYQHDPIRTRRTYEDPNPFRDSVLALDMFKESPLVFEPGTRYSYSTHGYALLAAVVERAGGQPFRAQVQERIAGPLGMKSLRPDFHQSEDIPHRTVGYRQLSDGRTTDAGDSNVAWKLGGGGFVSTVEDLARFGKGLLDGTLLSEETQAMMASPQPLPEGVSNYGLGLGLERLGDFKAIGHSGSQRNTRTALQVVPEAGLGVALMCNTEHADITRLARELLGELLR